MMLNLLKKKLLVVVDMQHDFIDGVLGTKEAIAIVPNVLAKINEYNNNGWQVVFTQDTHFADYLNTQEGELLPVEHCIYGTYGWKLYGDIKQIYSYHHKVFQKNTFGSIELGEYVRDKEYDEVEIIGVCSSICVISNGIIIKSFSPETKIVVDASCCACVTPESHQQAVETMKLLQINII